MQDAIFLAVGRRPGGQPLLDLDLHAIKIARVDDVRETALATQELLGRVAPAGDIAGNEVDRPTEGQLPTKQHHPIGLDHFVGRFQREAGLGEMRATARRDPSQAEHHHQGRQ